MVKGTKRRGLDCIGLPVTFVTSQTWGTRSCSVCQDDAGPVLVHTVCTPEFGIKTMAVGRYASLIDKKKTLIDCDSMIVRDWKILDINMLIHAMNWAVKGYGRYQPSRQPETQGQWKE
ncbi:hypothetical protein SDJN03_03611, partial [Cucurbita argyrosperma subsp. sororia]